jgi:transposase
MRGNDEQQGAVFSSGSGEPGIGWDHPLRRIRAKTDAALGAWWGEFEGMNAAGGGPSIAPEKRLRGLLLPRLYWRRRERLQGEEMNDNLVFRWLVGLEKDDGVWDETGFPKNGERRLAGEIAPKFFPGVVEQAGGAGLLSAEPCTVAGRLIEAWANRRSLVEKPEPPPRGTGGRGRKRLRDTHPCKRDPEAGLFRGSRAGEAQPFDLGPVLTENRNGLVVAGWGTQSSTKAEGEAALARLRQISKGQRGRTLGADKGYPEREFLQRLRSWGVVPQVAE